MTQNKPSVRDFSKQMGTIHLYRERRLCGVIWASMLIDDI